MERKREEKKKKIRRSANCFILSMLQNTDTLQRSCLFTQSLKSSISLSLYIYIQFFSFFSFFYFHFLNITTFDRSYNKKKKNKRSLKTILIIVRIFNLYNAVENNFEYLTKYGTNNYHVIKFFLLFHPNFKPCILLAFTLM